MLCNMVEKQATDFREWVEGLYKFDQGPGNVLEKSLFLVSPEVWEPWKIHTVNNLAMAF